MLLVVYAQSLASGATALRAVGVIDQATAPLLEQRLLQESRSCLIQPAHLQLDLREVTYLDRAGLDTLFRSHTRLTDGFPTLELLEPSTGVLRLLHEAHLDGASWMTPSTDQGHPHNSPDPRGTDQ
jgi:anti-anti-sigma factor